MKQLMNPYVYENDEDRRNAKLILGLIYITWVTYVIVFLSAIPLADARLALVGLIAILIQFFPFFFVRMGWLRLGSFLVVFEALTAVIVSATVGQGIRDLAIIAFPIIFIFAGLSLDRVLFRLSVAIALLAVAWLSLGEIFHWYVPVPFEGELARWINLVMVSLLLIVAGFSVNAMAENLRQNLSQAKFEIAQRKLIEEKLRFQGNHDVLTGIFNRFFFEEELARLQKSREYPISIIMVDVDDLKITNDSQGHALGDKLLQNTAMVLSASFRAGDILSRIGGDEFAALLPSTSAITAQQVVERIRENVAEQNKMDAALPVKVSIGVATAEAGELAITFREADQAMYADKDSRSVNGGKERATPR